MKITLESTKQLKSDGTRVQIEVSNDYLTIVDMWDSLIKPMLVAYGFSEKLVDELVSPDSR